MIILHATLRIIAVQCSTVESSAIKTVQSGSVLCIKVKCSAVQHSAETWKAVQYYGEQCGTVKYSAVLWIAVWYNAAHCSSVTISAVHWSAAPCSALHCVTVGKVLYLWVDCEVKLKARDATTKKEFSATGGKTRKRHWRMLCGNIGAYSIVYFANKIVFSKVNKTSNLITKKIRTVPWYFYLSISFVVNVVNGGRKDKELVNKMKVKGLVWKEKIKEREA